MDILDDLARFGYQQISKDLFKVYLKYSKNMIVAPYESSSTLFAPGNHLMSIQCDYAPLVLNII